ncbi:MAG: hypothetical protein AAFW87_09750 [Pseudomonadota bacterium]
MPAKGHWIGTIKGTDKALLWVDHIDFAQALLEILPEPIPDDLVACFVDEMTGFSDAWKGDGDADGWGLLPSFDGDEGVTIYGDAPELDNEESLDAFDLAIRLFEKEVGFTYDQPNFVELLENIRSVSPSDRLTKLKLSSEVGPIGGIL